MANNEKNSCNDYPLWGRLLAGESGRMTSVEGSRIMPRDIRVAIETPPSLSEDVLRQVKPLSM